MTRSLFEFVCLCIVLNVCLEIGAETTMLDKTLVKKASLPKCILSIAKTYFLKGSIISIVSAQGSEETSNQYIIDTQDLLTHRIMQEMQWSVVIKGADISKRELKVIPVY